MDPAPLLNERFTGFTPHKGILPPFVTCFGPSVYVSGDGVQFGTWDSPEPPTVEEAEALRVRRNKHFQVGRLLLRSFTATSPWHPQAAAAAEVDPPVHLHGLALLGCWMCDDV